MTLSITRSLTGATQHKTSEAVGLIGLISSLAIVRCSHSLHCGIVGRRAGAQAASHTPDQERPAAVVPLRVASGARLDLVARDVSGISGIEVGSDQGPVFRPSRS